VRGHLNVSSLALSRSSDHATDGTALPPGADLPVAASAFLLISSASPSGAGLPGGAAKGPHLTQSRHKRRSNLQFTEGEKKPLISVNECSQKIGKMIMGNTFQGRAGE
jgi:hypothetical protein